MSAPCKHLSPKSGRSATIETHLRVLSDKGHPFAGSLRPHAIATLIFVSAPRRARFPVRRPCRTGTFRFLIFRLRPRLDPRAGTLALPSAVGTPFGDWSQAKR